MKSPKHFSITSTSNSVNNDLQTMCLEKTCSKWPLNYERKST